MLKTKPIGEKILRRTQFRVNVEGVMVVLTIGNYAVELPYDTALKVGKMLWHGGKLAKKASGDESKRLIVFADLQPENADEIEAKMSVDRKSIWLGGSNGSR